MSSSQDLLRTAAVVLCTCHGASGSNLLCWWAAVAGQLVHCCAASSCGAQVFARCDVESTKRRRVESIQRRRHEAKRRCAARRGGRQAGHRCKDSPTRCRVRARIKPRRQKRWWVPHQRSAASRRDVRPRSNNPALLAPLACLAAARFQRWETAAVPSCHVHVF